MALADIVRTGVIPKGSAGLHTLAAQMLPMQQRQSGGEALYSWFNSLLAPHPGF